MIINEKMINFAFNTFVIICFIIFQVISIGCTQNRGARINRAPSFLEQQVIKEINLARQNPKRYAIFIEREKSYYVGKFIKRPGETTIITQEGVSAVDEAIRFLKTTKPVAPLKYSKGMSLAAMDHVKDQGKKGTLGHRGSDRSQPRDRVNRYGSWRWTVGENISYGREKARDIVMGLIIDDGVPGRGHRENLFNSAYKIAGVACGYHKIFDMMCVIDFAGEFLERK